MIDRNKYYVCEKVKVYDSLVETIINTLMTDRQAVVYTMHFKKDMTQQMIAKELNLSQPTVCRHLNSAIDIVSKYTRIFVQALEESEHKSLDPYSFYEILNSLGDDESKETIRKWIGEHNDK